MVKKILELYKDYPEIPYISNDRDVDKFLKEVKASSSKLVPRKNMIKFEDDLLAGDIILLWRINFGTYTNETTNPKYFEYSYGIDAKKSLEQLIERGYVEKMSVEQSLKYVPLTTLKTMLKEIKVPKISKMKRVDVDKAILENFSKKQLEDEIYVRGYQITSEGKEILNKYSHIVDKHPKKKL